MYLYVYENKSLPQVAANRIQRYALFLANYDYSIHYVNKSANNQCNDALSRLVVTNNNESEIDKPTINCVIDYFQGINKTI